MVKKLTCKAVSIIILTILGIVGAIAVTCVAITYIVKYVRSEKVTFCDTQECFKTAFQIMYSMDESVNPCENFYKFACGGYIDSFDIPDEFGGITVQAEISEKLDQQLRESLENETREGDPRTFETLQSFYKTCADVEKIEETSKSEISEIIKELGGWPVLEGASWNESKFSWTNLIYKIRHMGFSFNSFFEFGISPDIKNNTERIIMLDQARFVLDRVYLSQGSNSEIVQAYFEYMMDVAKTFGARRKNTREELFEALDFEIQLAKFSLPEEKRQNFTSLYNIVTIEQLELNYPSVPWLEYINQMLKPYVAVDANERIMLLVPSYFEAFAKLVSNVPKRTLANYAIWRMIAESANALNNKVREAETKFKNKMSGIKGGQPRWKVCLDFVSETMPLATGALYVRRHYDKDAKAKAVEMVENIYESYRQILEQVDWMDDQTKRKAMKKLDAMKINVAYSDVLLDNRKLDEFYQNVTIDRDSFLKSTLKASLALVAHEIKELRTPVDKNDWTKFRSAAVVNAFYQPLDNTIDLPAAILQGVFFSKDRPNYLNYGTIGFVIGHEITHGFDKSGSQFDENGNVVNWWDPTTEQEYVKRIQCMVDQYSNFTIKEIGLRVNGVNTLDENIADNGGIKEAYHAYNAWESRNGVEPALYLNYTSRQMFWIGAASAWCQKMRPEGLLRQVLLDQHSPSEFRIIGSFSNTPEFARDFQCPEGSPMNPVKKCTVW